MSGDPLDAVGQGHAWYGYNLVSAATNVFVPPPRPGLDTVCVKCECTRRVRDLGPGCCLNHAAGGHSLELLTKSFPTPEVALGIYSYLSAILSA